MTSTLAVELSFLSGRAYPSLNFLPPLSSIDPYSGYVGVNISLNNSFLFCFFKAYALSICSSSTNSKTDSFSLSILLSLRNLFILKDFNCHYLLWDLNNNSYPAKELFDWVISSDLLPLNDSDTPTFLHHSSFSRSSPDFSFVSLCFALSY